MKKYILLIIMFMAAGSASFSQNRISLNPGFTYYIWNSENSNGIMVHDKYRAGLSYGLSFQKEDLFGFNVMLEYSYHQITKKDILSTPVLQSPDLEVIYRMQGDAKLSSHNIDLAFVGKPGIWNITEGLYYGAGPSFVITNRTFDLYKGLYFNLKNHTIYDRLASSGIGLNAFVMYDIPLSKDGSFYFTSKLKLRYTHSIWFDKGARNLDDYSQDFITSEALLGLGYNF
ncbi:MAG: hypothetical protein ACM3Q2_17850 [Syntrophothermus sp.]